MFILSLSFNFYLIFFSESIVYNTLMKLGKSFNTFKLKTSTLLILLGLLTVVIVVAGLGARKEGLVGMSVEQTKHIADLQILTEIFTKKMQKLSDDIFALPAGTTISPNVIRDILYVLVAYHGKEKYHGDIYYNSVYNREKDKLFSQFTPPDAFITIKPQILDVAVAYGAVMRQVDKIMGITYTTSTPSSTTGSSSSSRSTIDKARADALKKQIDSAVDAKFASMLKEHKGIEKDLYKDNALSSSSSGIPSSEIPPGKEDLYMLKTQMVVPSCPASSGSKSKSNCSSSQSAPVPPCPPCERCPEPAFDCKKVPNYNSLTGNNSNQYLPRPVLNSFAQFGM
jgi:hypothetical protein